MKTFMNQPQKFYWNENSIHHEEVYRMLYFRDIDGCILSIEKMKEAHEMLGRTLEHMTQEDINEINREHLKGIAKELEAFWEGKQNENV